jgi:hypothetical protein
VRRQRPLSGQTNKETIGERRTQLVTRSIETLAARNEQEAKRVNAARAQRRLETRPKGTRKSQFLSF